MALIAMGSINVDRTRTADMLWPDAEGNNALESFKTTLSRLRKLLRYPHALLLQNRKLSLNPEICWLDITAFKEDISEFADAKTSLPTLADNPIIKLYSGPFLGIDGEHIWSIQTREQLRSEFLNSILKLGEKYETQQNWNDAVTCYEHGLNAEQLAESFYQRLIICYRQMDLPTEALRVYERCKKVFVLGFDIEPSARTKKLVSQLIPDNSIK